MPLAGTICCQDGSEQTFDHCLCEARAGRCQHPAPLLGYMAKQQHGRKDAGISASTLLGCPRRHYLEADVSFFESPGTYYPRWLGTLGHAAIELGGPYDGITQEVRYFRDIEVDGITFTLSGMPDWIDWDNSRIDDFKFVSFAPKSVYDSHEKQINFYGWLLQPAGLELEHASIHYFHGPSGPSRSRNTTLAVPLWTTDAVEKWIRRQLSPHATYQSSLRSEPEDERLGLSVLKADADYPWAGSCPFKGKGCCCDS